MDKLIVKKYYDEPKNKINIISASVFKLENSYKNSMRYYKGFKLLVENFRKYFPDFYLRIYFDDSIIKPKHENNKINNEI